MTIEWEDSPEMEWDYNSFVSTSTPTSTRGFTVSSGSTSSIRSSSSLVGGKVSFYGGEDIDVDTLVAVQQELLQKNMSLEDLLTLLQEIEDDHQR